MFILLTLEVISVEFLMKIQLSYTGINLLIDRSKVCALNKIKYLSSVVQHQFTSFVFDVDALNIFEQKITTF